MIAHQDSQRSDLGHSRLDAAYEEKIRGPGTHVEVPEVDVEVGRGLEGVEDASGDRIDLGEAGLAVDE
jgi:hypothetical protein